MNWHAPSRRQLLLAGFTGMAGTVVGVRLAQATPEQVAEQIKKISSGKTPTDGRIKLDLPTIAENGLVVPLHFEVESPMTEKEYVKHVHFYAAGNPNPLVASFHFTPLIPKAAAQIRIRLANTQNIVAVAEMSDGALYMAKKEVKVTIGGCGG